MYKILNFKNTFHLKNQQNTMLENIQIHSFIKTIICYHVTPLLDEGNKCKQGLSINRLTS